MLRKKFKDILKMSHNVPKKYDLIIMSKVTADTVGALNFPFKNCLNELMKTHP